jgi:hypothetical protein
VTGASPKQGRPQCVLAGSLLIGAVLVLLAIPKSTAR